MRRIPALLVIVLAAMFMTGTAACVATSKANLPLFDGKEAVALVNGEPITREEYEQEISSLHSDMMSEEQTSGKKKTSAPGKVDYAGLMKRLINSRLILQEAKNIGLNDLPEVREEVDGFSQKTLRAVLIKEQSRDVPPDEEVAEKLYKKAVGEWKFSSAMFKEEEDARNMETAVREGKDFDELAEQAVASGKAKGGKAAEYMKGDAILSGISDALLSMSTGSISPVIPVPAGYALLKLEDARYEDSPEKRETAQQEALQIKRSAVTQEFLESLKKKYAKTDDALLESLDYGSSLEQFEKLMKDERVISEIEGESPITVAGLGDELRKKYFHGIDRAIGKRDLNAKKYGVFDGMLEKKLLLKEAYRQDIKKTALYKKLVKNYEDSIVFGMFIDKVVLPEVVVMESDIKAYYDGHLTEYTSPGLMRLDSVVFTKRSDAEEAMRKLREGDQLSWLKTHAGGQVEKDADGLLVLAGTVVTSRELPDALKNTLAGTNAGDTRLYESPEGYFYVIAVVAVYPEQTEEYLLVRETIARQLFDERVRKGVENWADRLRAGSDIRVYIE